MYVPPTLKGVVFRDTDGDGVRDAGEPVVSDARVLVEEFSTDVSSFYGFPLVGRGVWVQTDAQGHYSVRLPNRTSSISPSIMVQSPSAAYRSFEAEVDWFTPADRTFDIGLKPQLKSGTVTLRTFIDTNGNGLLDSGETLDTLPADLAQYFGASIEQQFMYNDRSANLTRGGRIMAGLEADTWWLYVGTDATAHRISMPGYDPVTRSVAFEVVAGKAKTILIGIKPA